MHQELSFYLHNFIFLKYFLKIYFMCMNVFPSCMYVYHACRCLWRSAVGNRSLRTGVTYYIWLSTAICVLGIEPRSSERAASALGTISPAPKALVLNVIYCMEDFSYNREVPLDGWVGLTWHSLCSPCSGWHLVTAPLH